MGGTLLLAGSWTAAAPTARWMEYQLSNASEDRYRVDVNSLRRKDDIGFVTDDVNYAEPQEMSDGRTFTLKGEHLMIGCDDRSFALVRAYIDGGNLAHPLYIAPQVPAVSHIIPHSYLSKLALLACDPPPLLARQWVSLEPGVQVLPTPSRYGPPEVTRVWLRTGKHSRSGQVTEREYALERWDLYCKRGLSDAQALTQTGRIAVSYQRLIDIADEDDLAESSGQDSPAGALSDKARALLWVRFCGEGI